MIERIISITLPIFAIALIGFLYARAAKPNLSGANKISVDLALPALIFTSLSAKEFEFGQSGLLLIASTLLIFASGLLAAGARGRDRQAGISTLHHVWECGANRHPAHSACIR